MTQALPITEKINVVQETLSQLGGARRRYVFFASVLRFFWLAILGALAIVLADAIVPMHGYLRLALGAALLLFLIVGVLLTAPWRNISDRETLRDARRLERIGRLGANPILNALFLSHLAEQSGDALDAVLARRCVGRGAEAVTQVDAQRLIDRQRLRREVGWLWAALVVWLVVSLIHPRLLTGGFLRLADPLGVHAPFSLAQIDVQVSPEEIYQGDDADITAQITGAVPDLVELVELDQQGDPQRRWPMRSTPQATAAMADVAGKSTVADAAFQRRLLNMTEPMHFRIEAGRAQSQPFTIEPKPRPESKDAQDDAAKDGGGSSSSPGEAVKDGQGGESSGDGSLRDQLPELFEKLDELAAQMDALQKRANELMQNMPMNLDTPEGQQWLQDMEDLQNQLQQMQQMAQELAQMARDLAQGRPKLANLLTRMAAQLELLACSGLGMCPNPGPGLGTRQSLQGAGVAQGAGGQGSQSGATGLWLLGLNQSANNDMVLVNQMLMQLHNALSEVKSGGQADSPPEAERAVFGRALERIQGAERSHNQPDAVMQQTPTEYRPLTGRYFQRVAEDDEN